MGIAEVGECVCTQGILGNRFCLWKCCQGLGHGGASGLVLPSEAADTPLHLPVLTLAPPWVGPLPPSLLGHQSPSLQVPA